ncbi:MAG: response regulator [Deltaproteobacteria bacterium]|jgi:PAS domain S-box-containing protein|nr:response regulator [Deltaproteobacteria bacterium]
MSWTFQIQPRTDASRGLGALSPALAAGGIIALEVLIEPLPDPKAASPKQGPSGGNGSDSGQGLQGDWLLTVRCGPELFEFLGETGADLAQKEPAAIWADHLHPSDQDLISEAVLAVALGRRESLCLSHLIWCNKPGIWKSVVISGAARPRGATAPETPDLPAQSGAPQKPAGLGSAALDLVLRLPEIKPASGRTLAAAMMGAPAEGLISGDGEELEHYRLMLDTMPIACCLWDSNLEQLNSNRAVIPIFGLPDKSSYFKYFSQLSPPYQPDGRLSEESFPRFLHQALDEGQASFEWLFQTLEGDPIQSEVNLIKADDSGSEVVLGYFRDTRKLRAAEAQVERERTLLQKILDNSPVAFLISVDGDIRFLTPFARQTLGLNIDESILKIYADVDEAERIMRILDRKGRVSWQEVDILDHQGEIRHMLLNAFKGEYGGGIGLMFWLMDVTDMAEKERALSEAREAAEASTKAKSEFLANMSHEIRTPMNAIIGLCHLCLQTELDNQQHEYVYRTQTAAKALLRIINDILDFSKIEAGKMEMEQTEFRIDDLITETMEMQSIKAADKDLEFFLDCPEIMPQTVIGDPVRLAQVLNNLISNSIKFTAKGEVGVKVELIEEITKNVTLRFTVRDTGIGMTEDQMGHLFTPFTQADNSTTRKYGGTGLGLTISKRLVEMMGGEVGCHSQLGVGSVFTFTARFGLLEPWSVKTQTAPYANRLALAVDDNPSALSVLTRNLSLLGFEVTRCTSGEAAMARIKTMRDKGERLPELVVVDQVMNGMSGLETVRELAPLLNKAVMLLTVAGLCPAPLQAEAMEAGVKAVVTKPLAYNSLASTLSAILGRGRGPGLRQRKPKIDTSQHVGHLKGARILLVEDNEVNQMVASGILRKAGFVVKIASNGREAVEMVQKEDFALVLMDIQMPEMDGLEATRTIRSLGRFDKLPIVAMTAHAMTGDRDMSLQSGMNDHVNKPIDVLELFKTIGKWLPPEGEESSDEAAGSDSDASPAKPLAPHPEAAGQMAAPPPGSSGKA